MPTGVPIATAIVVMTRLPKIGLRRPPEEPGGGVIWVNTASERPPTPSQSSTPRMSTSHDSPNRVAAIDSPMAIMLRRRRVSRSAIASASHARVEAHQHETRCRKDDERDDEQDQSERNQRGRIKI